MGRSRVCFANSIAVIGLAALWISQDCEGLHDQLQFSRRSSRVVQIRVVRSHE
jgi:hypothetical protein